jgi:hypothetical protein
MPLDLDGLPEPQHSQWIEARAQVFSHSGIRGDDVGDRRQAPFAVATFFNVS